jgi:hypothetical protein
MAAAQQLVLRGVVGGCNTATSELVAAAQQLVLRGVGDKYDVWSSQKLLR